jgi:4-alpha-glucanotransferase
MNKIKERRAGILLHPTSLPSSQDSGDLGSNAYWFVDFLLDSGVSIWQTLPLGLPHANLSPYQCQSVHAGNPQLISLELLIKDNLLEHEQIGEHSHAECLEFSYYNFKQDNEATAQAEYNKFLETHNFWLKDYAVFRTLKAHCKQKAWWEWEEKYRDKKQFAVSNLQKYFATEIEYYYFEQFIFFKQWLALKKYANDKGIKLFGDLPIFVAADSVDVWSRRRNFLLNEEGKPTVVAGVPPDYFSENGQLWGNPHYDWEYMEANNFKWWVERLYTQQELFDIVRIDHFRGFEAYWEVDADETTAINGRWVEAPGEALFKTLQEDKLINSMDLVAEDLGIITQEVTNLREQFNIPGMKILQFAFDDDANNAYLPHNHEYNTVVYTGTHDNNTTLGWFNEQPENVQKHIYEYLGADENIPMPFPLIKTAYASLAKFAIIPMQDALSGDADQRMNIPGTAEGNWQWRFQWEDVPKNLSKKLKNLAVLYNRN